MYDLLFLLSDGDNCIGDNCFGDGDDDDNDMEEKSILVSNVFEEIRNQEAALSTDKYSSAIIEKVLKHATEKQLIQFGCGNYDTNENTLDKTIKPIVSYINPKDGDSSVPIDQIISVNVQSSP